MVISAPAIQSFQDEGCGWGVGGRGEETWGARAWKVSEIACETSVYSESCQQQQQALQVISKQVIIYRGTVILAYLRVFGYKCKLLQAVT